eukprot:CAMPEP_0113544544 /NCGR_PEP_ID=MMETSP0015_2-20120614/10770_1 /TAXON_ID=2838 /ORGANISM="Odontella" /LENGTH=208 /DNA_ID=CAMNT_0000444821 /DNA_START=183 /DNA_END=809 /DNA_ORIENTATION=- /assembly_acc=CAM_ASM_000160
MVKYFNAALVLAAGLSGAVARSLSGAAHSAAFIGGSRAFGGRTSVAMQAANQKLPIMADEEVMSQKSHGTSDEPVMKNLKWGCDYDTADRICNFNRHYAEFAGYWTTTEFLKEVDRNGPTTYYDSVTGVPLFTAPVGRSMDDYLKESMSHGWPSFRDEEVNWDYVRCLSNGECISTTGTHLGHNLPDGNGNRYCINLVSVAGEPKEAN